MPVRRCFGCERRLTTKPAALYGAWMIDEGRASFLLKLCSDCVIERLSKPVRTALEDEDGKVCSVCAGPFDGEPRGSLFLTAFLPRREMQQFELVGHAEHITPLQAWFEEYGLVAPNRGLGSSRGPENNQGVAWDSAW